MPNQKLFEEDSEEEVTIKTENEYAKKYDAWREKEEKHKLEQKYGDKVLNSDASISSDSEDESDDLPEVSEETETQFLKTLALLKTKDPRIYNPNYKFFDEDKKKESEKESITKKLTFADSDDDDDDDGGNIFTIEKKAPEIVNDTEQIANESTKKNPKEGKLKDFLTGKVEHLDNEVEQELAPLKALWSDPKLSEGEAFLRDYILNKWCPSALCSNYLKRVNGTGEAGVYNDDVPTLNSYLEEGDAGEAGDKIRDDDDLEADEETVEEQGKFERAYNFRFEEPDEEYLKRFPRTMNFIRPKDDRRSRKRAEVRTRKEEEKRKKIEEIARLKALKLKEIQEKIARIKEVTGNEELAFKEEDIEGDFDPEEHDRRMKAIFDEQYYVEADNEKPVFPDLDEELEIENWENYEPEYDQENGQEQCGDGPHCEDDDFNMDADYDPRKARANLLEEIKRNLGKKRRNRKRKSKLAELLSTKKPTFVPTVADKTYSEYMEEYYKMDCEDVIGGDLPTRFKYREVVPNDYGLTIEEILLADDRELTQWVPLKKIIKYRPANTEKGEVNTYANKAADVRLKRSILPSLFKDLPQVPEIAVADEEANKKKKNKTKKKQKDAGASENNDVKDSGENELINLENSQRENHQQDLANVSDDTPKNKKHKISKVEENSTELEISNKSNLENCEENQEVMKKRKKKQRNKDNFIIENIQNEGPSLNSDDQKSLYNDKGQNVVKSMKRKLEITEGTQNTEISTKKKKKKNKSKINSTNIGTKDPNKKDLKMKFKQKDKLKNRNVTENPLSKLSDERLKAYGLNPKKYRSFLKYKKF